MFRSIFKRSALRYFISTFFFIALKAGPALAQSTALPEAAQEAINKGIMATKVPDYLLAIRYFEEARKAAPQSTEVFFNLGLAESKIPGRELRAICWFGAYLTVNPAAENKTAVKEQMNMLLIKNQSNLGGLIKSLQDFAALKTTDFRNMGHVATLWSKAGDISSAIQAAGLISGDNIDIIEKEFALNNIAITQAESGDIEGAKKTAELIKHDSSYFKTIYKYIAIAQFKKGDFSGYEKSITAILERPKWPNSGNYEIIEDSQLRIGDTAGAKITCQLAQKAIDKYQKKEKYIDQINVAKDQLRTGDVENASKALLSAQKNIALDIGGRFLIMGYDYLTQAFIKADMLISAQITLDSMQTNVNHLNNADERRGYWQRRLGEDYIDLTNHQINKGDIKSAVNNLKMASNILEIMQNPSHKDFLSFDIMSAFSEIIKKMIAAKDLAGVIEIMNRSEWNVLEKSTNYYKGKVYSSFAWAYLSISEAQIIASDFNGAKNALLTSLKFIDLMEPSKEKSWFQNYTIKILVKIHDFETAQKVVDLIMDKGLKNSALVIIAGAQALAGDINSGLLTVDEINDTAFKSNALAAVAESQIKNKDIQGANKTLVKAQNFARLIKDSYDKSYAFNLIAAVQINSGDITVATANISSAKDAAEFIENLYDKLRAYTAIAETQIGGNNMAEVKKTLTLAQKITDQAEDTANFNKMWEDILKVQQKAGITNFIKPAPKLALAKLAADQQKEKILLWIKKLDDNSQNDCALNTDPFLDITSYLKSIPASDPNKYFDGLKNTADKIVKAQNLIEKMMKEIK